MIDCEINVDVVETVRLIEKLTEAGAIIDALEKPNMKRSEVNETSNFEGEHEIIKLNVRLDGREMGMARTLESGNPAGPSDTIRVESQGCVFNVMKFSVMLSPDSMITRFAGMSTSNQPASPPSSIVTLAGVIVLDVI